MRLKQLELQGFKTFATRTEFVFPTGITAIVGPNGSGKCVTGDTLVTLADGRDVPIRELVEAALNSSSTVETLDDGSLTRENPQGIQILSLNPATLRLELRPVASFIKRQSPATLLRIRTRAGREVTATPYHPFFTLDSGQLRALDAQELRVRVRLALPRRLPTAGSQVDLRLFKVLGRFEHADEIYVPHSAALRAWADTVHARFGTWVEWARAADVSWTPLKSFLEGQAINAATFVKLAGVSELYPPLDGRFKSHGAAQFFLPSVFTPELARFLGLLVAEGRNTSSNQVWFVNSDKAVSDEFERLAQTLFGVSVERKHYKPNAEDDLIYSRTLGMVLERLFNFPVASNSAEKQVPSQLLEADAETQWAFLSGLFEGDAYVCVRPKTQGKRATAYIEYVTASPCLAQQVVALLLRLDVFALLRPKQKVASNTVEKRRRTYYSVLIYGTEQLRHVAKHLAFVGEKRQSLRALRELPAASNPNFDLVPGVTALVQEAVRAAGARLHPDRKNHPKLMAYVGNACEASRNGLLEIVGQIERLGETPESAREHLNRLSALATSDVYWDEVVSVEQVPPPDEWVYDLSIAETHNFVAGNVIVHNSNVADAVRWVLGEQSYSLLRGKRTEDMIFAGSEQRTRAGMAEALLTLDNSSGWLPVEFTEVVIARRAYRSGENEYYLNGSRVRLRDVTELLGASGLARRTYAVIGQGLVDQALSLRPEERRELFEEAAGIAHYQSKRDEALKKLDETQRNLERVRDILAEIGPRLRALQRQSERSQQYERLAGELRDLQRTWYGYHWGHAQEALRVARQAADVQRKLLAERQQDLASLGDRLNYLLAQQAGLRTKLVEWQKQSAALHAQAQVVQRELAVMTERARLLKQQQVELEAETQPLQDQRAAQAERVKQAEAELAVLSRQLAAHQADIAKAEEVLTARQAERQTIAGLRRAAQDQAFRLASDATDRRNRRAQLAERTSELEREQAKHNQEQAQLQSELDTQRQTIAGVEADMAALAAQGHALKAQADAKALEIAACQSRQVELEEQLTLARAVETELRSRYEALGQVRAEMAGYDAGARAVLSARDSVPGVRDAMASLVQVGDEWERAVESALGADAQAIVVDDGATVEAIAARNLGRATLLPLDAMRALAGQRERAQREALEQQRRAQQESAERRHREQLERAEQQRRALRELTERQEQLQRQLAQERQRKQREMIEARRVARRERLERRQRERLEARPWWRKLVDRVFNIQPMPLAEFAAEVELDDVVLYEPDTQVAEAIHTEMVSVVQDPELINPEQVASPPRSPWLAASSVVTCDEAIRPAVDALLGNVYLVQDLAEGQRSLPDLPPGSMVVTRAGEVLRHSGAMTVGGGAGGGVGLLTREREWRELPAQLAAAQQRATQIETTRDHEARHQADLDRERAALQRSMDDLGKRARSRTQERDVLVRAAERLDQQINWQAALVKQTQGELDAVAEKDQVLAAELEVLSAKQQAADDDIRAAEARLAALPLEELTSQLSQLKTSAAVASQAAQGQQAIVRNERHALSQIDSQMAARGARAAQLARESTELEVRLGAQHAKQIEFSGQVTEIDGQLQPAQAELGRWEAEQQIIETQERTARTRLHEMESHQNAAVLEAGRREDELDNLRARMDEDLGLVELDMTEATGPMPLPLKPIVDELPTVTELPEGIETEIQRRKAQLHRIGPISPEVQQEFKETQERYNFLTTQNQDLRKAIESLNHVIAELDELMRTAFVETFEAIAEEFKGTFNRLFGGGTARIVLSEPDSPTTTGIDIVARPPGKRQQGLALLSGGERTLTAAALLFAILKVKPTPFCFLDEVDAALDEANVSRFRELLKELSASTQFVVITHNRGTVEAADTIYGITMGSDSASRALSLKLEGEAVTAAA